MSNREKKAPWVKWEPSAFLNGVFGFHTETVGVYSILLNLIYENGGPIDDNIAVLARRMSMRPTSLEKRLAELVKAKKIVRVDGVISNPRAEIEIEARAKKLVKTREKVGEKSVETRQNLHEKVNGFNGNGGLEEEKKKNRVEREVARTRAKAVRSVRIDPRRKVSDSNIVFARSRGLTKREYEFEWMKFVRYYAGRSDSATNAKSPDWDAQWESWVLSKAHELGREPLVDTECSNGKADPAHLPRDVWERQIKYWSNGGSWSVDNFGPEPGQPGCLVPIDLVRLS